MSRLLSSSSSLKKNRYSSENQDVQKLLKNINTEDLQSKDINYCGAKLNKYMTSVYDGISLKPQPFVTSSSEKRISLPNENNVHNWLMTVTDENDEDEELYITSSTSSRSTYIHNLLTAISRNEPITTTTASFLQQDQLAIKHKNSFLNIEQIDNKIDSICGSLVSCDSFKIEFEKYIDESLNSLNIEDDLQFTTPEPSFSSSSGMEQDINSNYYERQRAFSMTGKSSIFMEEDSSDYETTLTSGGSHGISYLPSIFSFKKDDASSLFNVKSIIKRKRKSLRSLIDTLRKR